MYVGCTSQEIHRNADSSAKNAETSPSQVSSMAVSIPVAEVQRIMTLRDWSNGNAHWSSSLEFDHCDGPRCSMRSWLVTDQVCPADAPEGELCKEIMEDGSVVFESGGFVFTTSESRTPTRCNLIESYPNSDTWWLKGQDCKFLGFSSSGPK